MELNTFKAYRRASGATPTTPVPLSSAAMLPATWVPWPLSSKGSLSLLTKSLPRRSGSKLASRSGCV